ncbi:two-component sensor histidine kinase [Sphingomonas metalli]|uniref:histidine kinase n=1 Tax=Sphingomonas metalli TaxID=1779358 RepID=A0A916T0F7_9SPHN|nr:ATP-binding protein [Sphingomonas metalli]GGB22169.1 two-component sensor histidine kinase [Sphingomonas metalli]
MTPLHLRGRLRRRLHFPTSLLGQIAGILLITSAIEFGISTLLYERAGAFAVRDDEARRLAEHLVVALRVLEEHSPPERPAIADELTTDRYIVRWSPEPPLLPPVAPALDGMRDQIVAWEPSLEGSGLRLRFASPGRRSVIAGHIRLTDGSWMRFSTREALRTIDLAIGRMLIALVPALALTAIGVLLIRRTLRPLRELTDAAERIGRAHPEPVPERGTGEVLRLTRSFNRMQSRIVRLIDERTRALAAVGHDLRTPLARLLLRVEAVEEAEVRDQIRAEVAEMEVMVGSLLAFLRGGEGEAPKLVDLAVLCATLADDAEDRGRIAAYRGPEHCDARVRPVAFKRALVNLVENALHYGDRLEITLAREAAGIVIRIVDDGPGIPEEALETVFDPFVRLDPARGRDTTGFGLGLSIVRRAVAAEGGRVALSNRAEGGLVATVTLPLPETLCHESAALRQNGAATSSL